MKPLIKQLPSQLQVRAQICRRDFFYFVQQFWETIIPEAPIWNWHIEYLCNELQILAERVKRRENKLYDLIINIPPGTTKSTICSVMYPVWCWAIDPTQRFLTGSQNDTLSLYLAVKSRDIIRSDKFNKMFPGIILKADQDNKALYENNKTGGRFATSVGGSPMGFHAHQIVLDDIINPKKATSSVELFNACEWMDKTLSTRKVDKLLTPIILIMQRLAERDPSGYLLSKQGKNIRHICLPGEITDDIKPAELKNKYVDGLLDPIRMNRKALQDMRIDLGSFGYAGQILQKPAPEAGGIIKKDWFQYFTMQDLMKLSVEKQEDIVWKFTVDGAFTKNKENAQSAILAYASFNRRMYIRDVLGVWEETPEFKNTLQDFVFRNGYSQESRIYIEPKATGLPVAQMLKSETNLNIVLDKSPTEDKIVRVRACCPFIESGRVQLLHGAAWIEPFIEQCAMFPNAILKDKVDCLTMAISRLNSNKDAAMEWSIL